MDLDDTPYRCSHCTHMAEQLFFARWFAVQHMAFHIKANVFASFRCHPSIVEQRRLTMMELLCGAAYTLNDLWVLGEKLGGPVLWGARDFIGYVTEFLV